MARAKAKHVKPRARRPHWMRITDWLVRRFDYRTFHCRICGVSLFVGDKVYWAPNRVSDRHPGYFWCDKPTCGGRAYEHYEKPAPRQDPGNN